MLFSKTSVLAKRQLSLTEMNRDIDTTLKNHIKDMVEGKCIKEGYVKLGCEVNQEKSWGSHTGPVQRQYPL